ncbi:MAG: LysR substrate-binding domain-containing protein, partial [Pseudomonadota bacterium]
NGASEAVLGDGPVFSDASLCLDAAAAGQGVFLTLETLAQDAIATGQLIPALPGRFRTDISYWFVEPMGGRRSPEVKAFREWIMQEMRVR